MNDLKRSTQPQSMNDWPGPRCNSERTNIWSRIEAMNGAVGGMCPLWGINDHPTTTVCVAFAMPNAKCIKK